MLVRMCYIAHVWIASCHKVLCKIRIGPIFACISSTVLLAMACLHTEWA